MLYKLFCRFMLRNLYRQWSLDNRGWQDFLSCCLVLFFFFPGLSSEPIYSLRLCFFCFWDFVSFASGWKHHNERGVIRYKYCKRKTHLLESQMFTELCGVQAVSLLRCFFYLAKKLTNIKLQPNTNRKETKVRNYWCDVFRNATTDCGFEGLWSRVVHVIFFSTTFQNGRGKNISMI